VERRVFTIDLIAVAFDKGRADLQSRGVSEIGQKQERAIFRFIARRAPAHEDSRTMLPIGFAAPCRVSDQFSR
jgi:hypothetical protein